jgi:hypothetical protein
MRRVRFSLSVIWGRSLLCSLLPHEPFVTQTILIKYGGKRYEAWLSDKGGYDENDELDERPISLRCRLEAEPARQGKVPLARHGCQPRAFSFALSRESPRSRHCRSDLVSLLRLNLQPRELMETT